MDQKIINRETYSGLDFLGDLGGLLDAFKIIGGIFVAPISSFALNARLLKTIFRADAPSVEN